MKKIYKFKTNIEGNTIYTTNPSEEHPLIKNEFPQEEIKITKENIINYILFMQEEPIYNYSELKKMRKSELMNLI